MSLPKFENAPGPPPPLDLNLDAIEQMAYHGFTVHEICEVVGIDIFWLNNTSKIFLSYRKGFLKSQLELRQRIFIDAKHGSSPAQAMAKKILEDAEYKFVNK